MKLSMIIEIPDYDPRDLFGSGPRFSDEEIEEDGVHAEAQELIEQLKKARTELDIHTIIWAKALDYFAQGYRAD